MSLVIESASNTTKATFFALFVPQFKPNSGANRFRRLTQRLATALVATLLGAHQPFVVAIPAVQGLVRGRKAFIARRGANVLDHVQASQFLLV